MKSQTEKLESALLENRRRRSRLLEAVTAPRCNYRERLMQRIDDYSFLIETLKDAVNPKRKGAQAA